MSSPNSSVDMDISDGADSNLSDMEVSDSDIDPPQVTDNLPNLTAQSRVMTTPSQMTQNVYAYQRDSYYQQLQHGYNVEPEPMPVDDDDDNDSLSSFFTAPLAAEHEDEPGLIRDEEEADMETLAYYKQKVAEYEEMMDQTEKEKRKLQQELLRLQVLSSMEKNKKSKQLRSNTPPKNQDASKNMLSAKEKPSSQKPPTPASKPVGAAPVVPPTNAPAPAPALAPAPAPANGAPVVPPANAAPRVSAAPPVASPISSSPWIKKNPQPSTAVRAITSVLPESAAQSSASSLRPVLNLMPVANSSNAKLTLSSLAQPGAPAPGNPSSMNTHSPAVPPVTAPVQQRHTTSVPPRQSNISAGGSTETTSKPATLASRVSSISISPTAPTIPQPLRSVAKSAFVSPPLRQSNQQAARIPTPRPVQNQRPSNAIAEVKRPTQPTVTRSAVNPNRKGSAFKPYESPLKRYGLANTNANGPFAGNPERQMCKYETVGGTCNDDTCQALHFRDFQKNM